jgi:hypothetical protein
MTLTALSCVSSAAIRNRNWWTVEAREWGSDWRGLLDQHQDVLNRLRLARLSS